jgi:WXG100 family type VII secretion target
MSFIKVTPEELRTQADSVARGASEVQDVLQRLLGQVRDLAGRWEGAGSSSFQQLFDEWNRGAEMTRQGMEGIAKFLAQAAQQYEDTDRAISSAATQS